MEHACIMYYLCQTECLSSSAQRFVSRLSLLSCRCHLCPEEEVLSLSVLAWLQETQRHHISVYWRAVPVSVQSAHGTVLLPPHISDCVWPYVWLILRKQIISALFNRWCFTEGRKSCRSEMTCRWVNPDRMLFFWVDHSFKMQMFSEHDSYECTLWFLKL